MSTGPPPTIPHQKLTVDYLARQLPIFEERVPRSSQQPPLKFPTNSPDNLPVPPLLPGEEIQLQQHRVVCTDCFQEPAVGAIYITNYRLIFNGNSISDPESLDALQEIQFNSKKDSSTGDLSPHRGGSKGGTLLRFIGGKGSQEPSFSSYITTTQEQKAGEAAPGRSSRLQGIKQRLGSLRRSPKRTSSESSTATVTSFTFAKPAGQGEDYEDGGEVGVRQKRKGFFHDTVSLDSMSVSSLSEFSECPTTGTDETPEQRLYSPVAEIESETLLEPVDYFNGHPGKEDEESVFVSIPSGPPLSIGSCVTVDSGINMPESVQSSSAFPSMASSTGEQLPVLILPPDAGCGADGSCSGVPKPNQNGLEPVEEPDFEKSLELDGDPIQEQKHRQQKLHGSWYRKKSSVLILESDSEDNADFSAEDSWLHPDDSVEGVPTGYSQIEILGSVEKPPACPDVAEDVSRVDRADTITNSDTQADGSVLDGSPVLPHSRPPTDTSIQASANSRHPSDCAEGVPTGYSKIEILASVEKPPVCPSPSPVCATELHTSEAAVDDSRVDRADTITNGSIQADDSVLHPDDCAGSVPTGYSKIEILGSIEKPPAHPSPVQHATDIAEDDSRMDRADTITNSSDGSVHAGGEGSPALPRSRPLTDTDSIAAPSSGGDATETPPVSSTDLLDLSDAADPEPAYAIDTEEPQIPKPATTKIRSFSSPRIKKKPKPLPRAFQRKLRSLDNLGAAHSSSGEREAKFLSSLPPSFKPTPAPRSNRGSQEQVQQQTETEEVNGQEPDLSSSLPAGFLLTTAAAQDAADSPPTAAARDDQDRREIVTKPKSVSSPPVPLPKSAPVPPPRTKRKSKFRKTSSESSSSNSASSLSNLPGKESPSHTTSGDVMSRSQSDVTESTDGACVAPQEHSHTGPSHDRSGDSSGADHPVSPDLPKESHDSSEGGGSPGLPEGSSSECQSPVSEDPLERSYLWQSVPELSVLALPGEREGGEESRLSKVSMEVNRGSSIYRPLSVQLSPLDSSLSPFGAERDNRGFIMSHSGIVTWSPRSRHSQKGKSPLPASTRYTLGITLPLAAIHSVKKIQSVILREQAIKLSEGLLILCRNFHSMKLHVHPHNTYDTDGIKELLDRHFMAKKPAYQSFAFAHRAAIRHPNPTFLNSTSLPNFMHLSDELERLGLQNSKLWRVTKLLQDHPDICPSYPPHLIVPIVTPDLDLIRGAPLYREGRFPTLCWVDRESGAALLRAAITNAKRGLASSHLEVDEALLNAICGCNQNARGNAKLFIFTEGSESSGFPADPMRTNLTAEEVRTYYYHNCKFIYAENPPTFKSVRHSFNKLQAMLENRLPDEDYLIALDGTRWLPRVGELLATASSVCHTLKAEAAHVLVSYESGWDRTAQIVSLAQLLLDPYYRTMDGFQVLVQKEWLWFGHPFSSRHTRRGKVKEDGPVFMQWIDCVWQVMHQCPSAFEFNQRFLMMLVEYCYSCRFGDFMMNSVRERKERFSEEPHKHKSVSSHTASLWTWIGMVNAAGHTFFSELYDPLAHPGVIYPNTALPSLKLWTSHYCRYKAQEDITTVSTLQRQLTELVHLYKRLSVHGEHSLKVTSPVVTKDMSTSPPPVLADESQEWKRHNHSPMLERQGGRPAVTKQTSNRGTKLIQQLSSIEQHLASQGIDPSICKNIEMGQKICQGYLIKLGAVRKNWRKRWFVLDFNCQYLAYFENQDSYTNRERPKGVIQLNDIRNVYQSTKRREHLVKHIFTVDTPIRTYYFQAPTILTMELWMACLRVPVSSLQANSQ